VNSTKNFTVTNNKGKEIEFRFIATGAPYGLSAINKGKPLWEVVSKVSATRFFIIGQWSIETVAEHKDGQGWCLDGGALDFNLDESLAAIAKENSIKALQEEKAGI
jgi:hypothetical protein